MKIVAIFLLAGCSLANPGFSQAKLVFFTSFDGTRIYYEVSGKGYPVLLLHGFMKNGSDWKKIPLYDSLLKTGYKVITADLRGNGKSGKPHTPEAYAEDAEAKDLIGLITYLHMKKYAVVGYSRGSIIATRVLVLDKRSKPSVLGRKDADFTNP